MFGTRFLRKCSSRSEEWEDVGDSIAREKTSQVLRDAIQARKSFSKDRNKFILNDTSLPVEQKRKTPPQKEKTPPVQQSFQPSHRKQSVPQWRTNPSVPLAYRTNNHVYSPAYSSIYHHPYNSYRRVPVSDPGNSIENAPNFSSASLPYQYPVTPTSSSLALSTATKRQRYSQDSPLIQGYHQYPYPTPIRSVNPPSPPLVSTVFTTPTNRNTNVRGLPFSPNKEADLTSLRRISTLQTTKTKFSSHEMTQIPPPPRQKSKVHTRNRSDDNQDFDSLLTDDVLSDSESKNNSTHLFSSQQDDLMF